MSNSLRDVIISRLDVKEYIEKAIEKKHGERLHKSGRGYHGKCPIHDGDGEKTIWVTPPTYFCFSCGSGGSVINFVMDMENVGYHTALEMLADELNIDWASNETYKKQKSLVQHNEDLLKKFQKQLPQVIDYLKQKRGLTDEIIEAFRFGYGDADLGKNDGLVIPITDICGRVIAFALRQDIKPKYLNTKNNDIFTKSETLYNLDRARKLIVQQMRVYVVEGYLDAASGDQLELPTVAYMGQEISKEQIGLIKQIAPSPHITVYIAPDNDDVGKRHTPKMREKFQQYAPKCNVRVVLYPENEYTFPDGTTRKVKDFNDCLLVGINPEQLPTEHIDLFCLKNELEPCRNIEDEYLVVTDYIKSVTNPMIKADIAKYLSDRWKRDEKTVKEFLAVTADSEKASKFKDPGQCIKEYEYMICNDDGISLGFPGIDKSLDGARKTDCILIGATPGIGKTFVGIEFALHQALRNNRRVLFFSMEMSAAALYERIIGNILGVDTRELKQQVKAGLVDFGSIVQLLQKRIVVVDESDLSLDEIKDYIREANVTAFDGQPVDMIVVDYLQIMKKVQELADLELTVTGFKKVAKQFNLIAVILSQLNRETKAWTEPEISQLKGSSAIEASADIIFLLWKEEENPKLTLAEKQAAHDQIKIKIGKARRGCGRKLFTLFFDRKTTRIREMVG